MRDFPNASDADAKNSAEELHDDVLAAAEENGIDPDDIEWEENPYDDEDPDDFYYCEWESDGEPDDEEDEDEDLG